jgi:hypothetical protein
LSLKVTKDGVAGLLKSLRAFEREQVLVGIPVDDGRPQARSEDQGPINNATIGYIMENGSPAAEHPGAAPPDARHPGRAERDRRQLQGGGKALLEGKIKSGHEAAHPGRA